MLRIHTIASVMLLTLLPVLAEAADIRKIVHPDGRVEYTNLTDKQRKVHYTNLEHQSTKRVYKYRNDNGVLVFSDQRPIDFSYEELRFDCFACKVGSTVNWHTTPLNTTAYQKQVKQMATRYEVEEALVRAVIHAESAFNAKAVSRAGAQGLMQLMPTTANELGVSNSFDVDQNIEGGTRYLAALLDNFGGDLRLATAAYNAGPGAVSRYNGVPPYAETQAYVERVLILKARYAKVL